MVISFLRIPKTGHAMAQLVPVYKDQDEMYRADSCAPVVDALARGTLRSAALAHGHYPGRKLPPETLPGVKSLGYWDASQDQDWGLPWHRNEGVEFTFLESGTLGFAVDNREYALTPDDLTITRPWQEHRVGLPHVNRCRLHFLILDVGMRRPNQDWRWPDWLVLSRPDLSELTDVLRHNERPVWKAPAAVRRCVLAISHAVESDRAGSHISRVAVQINEFFVELLEMFRHGHVRLDRSLSSSRRAVELFLADVRARPERIQDACTVEAMAAACGLGTTQFIFHVKRLTNVTPVQYLNHCRLERAKELLCEQPEKSITNIALACGFCSSQYFATLFKRRFGRAPHELRSGAG